MNNINHTMIEYLHQIGALNEYVRNTIHQKRINSLSHSDIFNENGLICNFIWNLTIEGSDYWGMIQHAWEQITVIIRYYNKGDLIQSEQKALLLYSSFKDIFNDSELNNKIKKYINDILLPKLREGYLTQKIDLPNNNIVVKFDMEQLKQYLNIF